MTKKTLSSIRIEQATIDKMRLAIKKYNDKNIFAVSESEFRRLAYELLSELILQNKPLPIAIK